MFIREICDRSYVSITVFSIIDKPGIIIQRLIMKIALKVIQNYIYSIIVMCIHNVRDQMVCLYKI